MQTSLVSPYRTKQKRTLRWRRASTQRYPGQLFDAESGTHYNYFRDYEPSTGRYVQSDPIGLRGGLSTYGYAGSKPIRLIDPMGLAEEGPWHPDTGVAPGCKGNDDCATLITKMAILKKMHLSHVAWDAVNGPRHTDEIRDLSNAMANCEKFFRRNRCKGEICPAAEPELESPTDWSQVDMTPARNVAIMVGTVILFIGGWILLDN